MEPTPALPKGGSLNEAQYIYSPPLGRVGVGSSPSLWEGRGRLLLSPLFDGISNPVALSIGICNAVVVAGLQIRLNVLGIKIIHYTLFIIHYPGRGRGRG